MKLPLTVNRLGDPNYNPGKMLDEIIHGIGLGLRNDAGLCRLTGIAPPVVSKIRAKRIEISDSVLLRFHDATGVPVNRLRSLMGVAEFNQN